MLDDTDSTLLNSALQSGRKLVLSDAGKLILNDPKFRKTLPSTVSQPPPLVSTSMSVTQQAVSTVPFQTGTLKFENLRKKPVFTPVTQQALTNGTVVSNNTTTSTNSTTGKSMPLKTNKVIKILSAEEFKLMCGNGVGGNTLKKISTESFPNGPIK